MRLEQLQEEFNKIKQSRLAAGDNFESSVFANKHVFNEEQLAIVENLVKEANDLRGLQQAMLSTGYEWLLRSQAFSVISKFLNSTRKAVKELLQDEAKLDTYSDAGSLKVGSGSMTMLIPNGYGDGNMKVAFVKRNHPVIELLEFFTTVNGNINLYAYDCGDDIKDTIEGDYSVYYGDGYVIFAD